jgi:hypothetical protein
MSVASVMACLLGRGPSRLVTTRQVPTKRRRLRLVMKLPVVLPTKPVSPSIVTPEAMVSV